jgi:hypothetical protein
MESGRTTPMASETRSEFVSIRRELEGIRRDLEAIRTRNDIMHGNVSRLLERLSQNNKP